MSIDIKMAWRNIWRNPRRTILTISAIAFASILLVFMLSFQFGSYEAMINASVKIHAGHIQVHHKGYRNDPVIENRMTDPEVLEKALKKSLPPGAHWTSRVRVNAVVSNARHSDGVTLVGIDLTREAKVSFIAEAITEGRFLNADDKHGIVVGRALVDKFESKSGRKLVLMSQDTDREIASRAFRIVGIFKSEMEATEKQFVFITKASAQHMLKLKNGMSEVSIILPDRQKGNQVADSLRVALPSDYEVQTWEELLPILTAYLEIFDGFTFLWYLVVFVAMGFGIVNTTLMAVFERIREFGLLKALGMKPWWIIKEVLTESFFLLIIGMAIGNIMGFLSILALSGSGIDLSALAAGAEFAGMSRVIYPAISVRDVTMANLVVFILGLLVSIYPAMKAARFTPVEALAHT